LRIIGLAGAEPIEVRKINAWFLCDINTQGHVFQTLCIKNIAQVGWQIASDKAHLRALIFEFICQGETTHEMPNTYLHGRFGSKNYIHQNLI
jgi:hypothetical protein